MGTLPGPRSSSSGQRLVVMDWGFSVGNEPSIKGGTLRRVPPSFII
jgi:hypothetical protein